MKRISAALALTAALSFGVSAYAQSNQTQPVKPAELKDVPAGHWAQEAIKIAADCGLLRGFPDGTYRGQQPFTRYQAAVVIARLLEVIKTGQCGIGGGGLSSDQLEAIQNAVQELSADLAQLGVRVAELEDNAVTQDDLARVEELATQARDLAEAGGGGGVSPDDLARVEEIANQARDLAEAAAAVTGADPEALKNLTDQVEAASIAADTALAQSRELQDKVDELSGRVDDLEGQLGELTATVEGQADSIAALNDLVVLLNQDVLSLQDRVATLEAAQADLQAQLDETVGNVASQEDLEALREFTTLLRRDQTALQDRVADLEARTTKNEADIKALDGRVTILEANAFTITGSISLGYRVSRTWFNDGSGVASDFDIDRLGLTTSFSSGTNADGDSNTDFADFSGSLNPTGVNNTVSKQAYDALGVAVGLPTVVNGNREGRVRPDVNLTFALKPRNLLTSPNNYPAGSISLSLTLDNTQYGGSNNSTSTINPINLVLNGLTAQFSVGAAPVIINYGIKPAFKFDNYAFNNGSGRGDGFVADVSGGGVLPFSPTLTLVYGSKGAGHLAGVAIPFSVIQGTKQSHVFVTLPSRGRITVTFSDGTTSSSSDADTGDQDFVFASDGITVKTVTFDAAKSINGANGDNLYFRGVKAGLSIIPGFTGGLYYADEGLDANGGFGGTTTLYGAYFGGKLFGLIDLEGEHNISIPAGAAGASNASYIKAGIGLGIFSVGGNFRFIENAYANLGGDGAYVYKANQSGFGVDLGVNLGIISLGVYYDTRTKLAGSDLPNGPKADTLTAANSSAVNFGVSLTLRLLGFDITPSYTVINEAGSAAEDRRVLGVKAVHDGSKADALIGGLNLYLGYENRIDSIAANNRTRLTAYVDFTLGSAPGFTIQPRAWYNTSNTTTDLGVRADVGLPFLFGSRLNVAGAFDSTSEGFSAGTVWVSAGLSFSQFLLPNSTFAVSFALRNDTNRNGRAFGPSFAGPRDAWGEDAVGNGGNLYGLYTQFSYFDLVFAYGIFSNTPTGGKQAWGQEFKISYKVTF
jgi:predicted  nucleic acid-binding Zn-ribbon protein